MDNRILLSFCFAGRNDGYLGNFTYRLSTALNFLALSAERAGLNGQIEAVVTDWNSETPLTEALQLNPNASRMTRFFRVFPDVARLHHDVNKSFNGSIAINVAIRRASGSYICALPVDILISETALFNLVRLLRGEVHSFLHDPKKCFFKLAKRVIPFQLVESEPTMMQWDEILQAASSKFENDCVPELSSATGGFIASYAIWEESRGINEKMRGWGFSDHELGLRIETVYPSIDTSFYGVIAYDMDQDPLL